MNIRELRQSQFVDDWIFGGRNGILLLAPRFGKTRVAVNILKEYSRDIKVLIAYPETKIKKSWMNEFEIMEYNPKNITFTTHVSLYKHINEKFDIVILDEIHTLSERQMEACKSLQTSCKSFLGLTGTLSEQTAKTLRYKLRMHVIASYSMEQSINEGVLPDYEINVVKVALDNKKLKLYKGKMRTEKQRFDNIMWVINKEEDREFPNFYLRLKLIEVLQNSIAKRDKTIELIRQFNDERLLVFCGRTNIADSLGIPSYHSKSKEKELFEEFLSGKEKHLAVVRIGNAGVTFTPLSKVIINYFDSDEEKMTQKVNRAMSMEYDTPDKKAIIYIITSNEEKELAWLKKALRMFSSDKIKYI